MAPGKPPASSKSNPGNAKAIEALNRLDQCVKNAFTPWSDQVTSTVNVYQSILKNDPPLSGGQIFSNLLGEMISWYATAYDSATQLLKK
jgi:hypothetical protein